MVPKMVAAATAMLVLLSAGLTAPLLAQTTHIDPEGGGNYYSHTINPDGSTSSSFVDGGLGGNYYVRTYNSDGSTSSSFVESGPGGTYDIYPGSSFTPYPVKTFEENEAEEDANERRIARYNREVERKQQAEERELNESLAKSAREDTAETRELYRIPASEPIHSMNYNATPSSYAPSVFASDRPPGDYMLPTVRRSAHAKISHVKQACPKAAVDAWFKADARLMAREARQCKASPLACDMRQMPPLICGHKTLQRAHANRALAIPSREAAIEASMANYFPPNYTPAMALPDPHAAADAAIDAYTRKMLAEEKKCGCLR